MQKSDRKATKTNLREEFAFMQISSVLKWLLTEINIHEDTSKFILPEKFIALKADATIDFKNRCFYILNALRERLQKSSRFALF